MSNKRLEDELLDAVVNEHGTEHLLALMLRASDVIRTIRAKLEGRNEQIKALGYRLTTAREKERKLARTQAWINDQVSNDGSERDKFAMEVHRAGLEDRRTKVQVARTDWDKGCPTLSVGSGNEHNTNGGRRCVKCEQRDPYYGES